jgi:hypothetical protein
VQGGDPSGTGKGGESAWGAPFRDEFDSRLQHDKRGVVSMANSGANTNGSQFFITMKATPHLDLKHGIFARVVGGMECLERIEQVDTDEKEETPLTEIKLLKVNVFVNPIKESEELFEQAVKDTIANRQKVVIPSATRSINEQKQAIAASSLAIKNKEENLSLLDAQGGEDATGSSGGGVSVGKYLHLAGKKQSRSESRSGAGAGAGMDVGAAAGAGTGMASAAGAGAGASSAEDKVAAFLRSQGGGLSTAKTHHGGGGGSEEELPSKKKKKVAGGGFNNW